MKIPFTSAEFYRVFSACNTAVWQMQRPLASLGWLGVRAVVLFVRQTSNASLGSSNLLRELWAWQALADRRALFVLINQLATLIVQARDLMPVAGKASSG